MDMITVGIVCLFVGVYIGVWMSYFVMKRIYDPWIEELNERVNYWYNYNRTK
jgi:uncharacterized protein YneF (UPF0154 family)